MEPHTLKMAALIAALILPSLLSSQPFTASAIVDAPGIISSSISVGDYDKDGNLDILLTGAQMNIPVLSVYTIENGKVRTQSTDLPKKAKEAQWLDYDQDGDLDVFAVLDSLNADSYADFFINEGGKFTPLHVNLPKLPSVSYSVADYDGDQDYDVLIGGVTKDWEPRSYLMQNNNSQFTSVEHGITVAQESMVLWNDYDHDGDLDVVTTDYGFTRLFENENNNFSAIANFAPAVRGNISWGDFDEDGDEDFFVKGFGNEGAVAKIYVNNGNKTFDIYDGLDLIGAERGTSCWLDFDSDGDLDVFHSGFGQGVFFTELYERKNGTYTKINDPGLPTTIGSMSFLDYDKDGDSDAFVPSDNSVARIYQNNHGINPFGIDARPAWPVGLIVQSNTTTDLILKWINYTTDASEFLVDIRKRNSDSVRTEVTSGSSYLVTGLTVGAEYIISVRSKNTSGISRSSNEVTVRYTQPNFVKEQTLPSLFYLITSASADIDNDGSLDLIYSGSTNENVPSTYVMKNINGSFVEQAHNLPALVTYDLDWSDYDHDGDQDLLMCGIPPGAQNAVTKIMINEGNFSFSESTQVLKGVRSGFARWVDVNADGYDDIYISGTFDNNNQVFHTQLLINQRDNSFEEVFDTGIPTYYQADVEVGDFDNDGFNDLIISGLLDGNMYTYLTTYHYHNDGNNKFSAREFLGTATGVTGCVVESADLDHNGFADVIFAGNLTETVIFWNHGGRFTKDTKHNFIGFTDGKVETGDLDNDGDADILIAGQTMVGQQIGQAYINNGDGTFIQETYPLIPHTQCSFSLGDFDNDGDLDVFEGGSTSGDDPAIFINGSAIVNTPPTVEDYSVTPFSEGFILDWVKSDNETESAALTVNIFLKDLQGNYLYNSIADEETGRLLKPVFGNMYFKDRMVFENLPLGQYVYGIQTIDNSFNSSAFVVDTVDVEFLEPILVDTDTITCSGSPITFYAYSSNVEWYSDAALTTIIDDDNEITINANGDTTIYAISRMGAEVSEVVQVNITVHYPMVGSIARDGNLMIAPSGAVEYQWYKQNNVIQDSTSQSITASGYGVYKVTASNVCGTGTFEFSLLPFGPFLQVNDSICVGADVVVSATGTNVKWYNLAGEVIGTGASISFDEVTASDTIVLATHEVEGFESEKTTAVWDVNNYPDATLEVTDDGLVAPEGTSFEWYRNGLLIESGTRKRITVAQLGLYHVIVSNHGCTTVSDKVMITETTNDLITSIGHDVEGDKLYVYTTARIDEIRIFDRTGRLVKQDLSPEKIADGYVSDVGGLGQGVYIAKVIGSILHNGKFIRTK